jgi:hypothetical protein
MSPGQVFQRALPVVRILYGALVFSTVLLAFVAFQVPGATVRPPQATELVLVVAAVVVAVASFVVPRVVGMNNARLARIEVSPPQPRPDGTSVSAFANPELAARRAMALGQTTFILKMALSEAVSLFGLCLHMLGAPASHFVPLLAAGTVLSAIRFPTARSLVADLERAKGASFAVSMDGGTF